MLQATPNVWFHPLTPWLFPLFIHISKTHFSPLLNLIVNLPFIHACLKHLTSLCQVVDFKMFKAAYWDLHSPIRYVFVPVESHTLVGCLQRKVSQVVKAKIFPFVHLSILGWKQRRWPTLISDKADHESPQSKGCGKYIIYHLPCPHFLQSRQRIWKLQWVGQYARGVRGVT